MKPYVVLAALGLLLTSSCITEPLCACSPPGGGTAVITGTVGDPRSAPVEGAAIRVRLVHDGTCEEPTYTLTRTVGSDADGRFRHTESWSGGRKCFRVWAEPPQGSELSASEPQNVRIDFLDAVIPDSVDLRLTLR